jgi:hypothetical protein
MYLFHLYGERIDRYVMHVSEPISYKHPFFGWNCLTRHIYTVCVYKPVLTKCFTVSGCRRPPKDPYTKLLCHCTTYCCTVLRCYLLGIFGTSSFSAYPLPSRCGREKGGQSRGQPNMNVNTDSYAFCLLPSAFLCLPLPSSAFFCFLPSPLARPNEARADLVLKSFLFPFPAIPSVPLHVLRLHIGQMRFR